MVDREGPCRGHDDGVPSSDAAKVHAEGDLDLAHVHAHDRVPHAKEEEEDPMNYYRMEEAAMRSDGRHDAKVVVYANVHDLGMARGQVTLKAHQYSIYRHHSHSPANLHGYRLV